MNIKQFNEIVYTITNKPIGYTLFENSATYSGMYNGIKVIVKSEDLGFQRTIYMNGKTYSNFKLNDIILVGALQRG